MTQGKQQQREEERHSLLSRFTTALREAAENCQSLKLAMKILFLFVTVDWFLDGNRATNRRACSRLAGFNRHYCIRYDDDSGSKLSDHTCRRCRRDGLLARADQ